MKALILSCGTGGGHDAAGLAVKEELLRRGHQANILNPYTLKSSRTAAVINQLYIRLVQKAPAGFGLLYNLGELYRRLPFRSPVYFLNGKMSSCVKGLLEREKYDVIVMPHLFPAEVLTNMKNHGVSVPKTVFIATDYTCIPFTEETGCDAYVIPSKDLLTEFTGRGIPPEKIHPLGIPVRHCFAKPVSKEEAKKLLGLDPQKKYLLLTGGSMGAGKIVKAAGLLYRHLKGEAEIIVICGSNQRLYERLKESFGKKIIIIGHTDKMDLYLKLCEAFLSKPGGLSSTEAAVSGVPLLHILSIPGCETHNMRFFSERGMSVPVKSLKKELIPALDTAFKDADRIKENQHRSINPNSARDICTLLEQLIS